MTFAELDGDGDVDGEARLRRAGVQRSASLGDLTLTYLPDGWVRLKPNGVFAATEFEELAALAAVTDAAGMMTASVGAILIEGLDAPVLIDAGYGVFAQPDSGDAVVGEVRGGELPASLAKAGIDPHDVETILVTHAHVDHVGWLSVHTNGRPFFPRARVLFNDAEWAHASAKPGRGLSADTLRSFAPRVDTFGWGDQVLPRVTACDSSGHTPGHTSYLVEGSQETALVFGDAMHTSAQVRVPTMRAVVDRDCERAKATRQQIVENLLTRRWIGVGMHFADVVFGRAEQAEDSQPRWAPLETGVSS